jgi:hypothetical protein
MVLRGRHSPEMVEVLAEHLAVLTVLLEQVVQEVV